MKHVFYVLRSLCSEGSVVAALDSHFVTTKHSKTEVENTVKDTLTIEVKSGKLPVPPGETFAPLMTVKTSLPQVAFIPDYATSRCLYVIPAYI